MDSQNVYKDLIDKYKDLNENESKSILLYKSKLYKLINTVSCIDGYQNMDSNILARMINDDEMFNECIEFGKELSKPENIFLRFSVFNGIDFNSKESLVNTAKKTLDYINGAFDKIILEEPLVVYRTVSHPINEKLDVVSKGDIISSSISFDESLKFYKNNDQYDTVFYKMILDKGTPVLVTPYSILNEYENVEDMLTNSENKKITMRKCVNHGQREIMLLKSKVDLEEESSSILSVGNRDFEVKTLRVCLKNKINNIRK